MEALSFLSSVKLDCIEKFRWMIFLLCIFTAYYLFQTYSSMKRDMWNRIGILESFEYGIDKTDLSCDYYIENYNELCSHVTGINTKLQLLEKIVEYKNKKVQNDLDRNYFQTQLNDFNDGLQDTLDRMLAFALCIEILLIIAFIILFHHLWTLYENSKVYLRCQSCGRTQNSILMNFGSERDGKFSRCFCNQCYVAGKFINPNMTLEDMTVQVRKDMKEKNASASTIECRCHQLKNLKRWVYYRTY